MMWFHELPYLSIIPADPNGQDYSTDAQSRNLDGGAIEVCAQFGALDDDLAPVLEDTEFYQTTDDNADVSPELALTNVFIEDNDGKLSLYVRMIQGDCLTLKLQPNVS